MRNLSKRSVNRPRPVLMLETLEDRCVLSVGGLLSALQPLATAKASPSPLSSVLNSLVAVPTTALSSVNATGRDLGGTVLSGPVKAPTLDVSSNLNVDVLFIHAENLGLNIGVNPVGSDQAQLTLAVGRKVAGGSTGDAPLSVAPQVQLDAGGSNFVGSQAATLVTAPGGAVLDAQVGAGSGGGVAAFINPAVVPGTLGNTTGEATAVLPTSSAAVAASLIAPTANISNATVSNSPAAVPPANLNVPSSAVILTSPRAVAVDGGGSGSSVEASVEVASTAGVAVADGAAADAVARPIDLGGGTEAQTVLANPDLEASGLATCFQPYSLEAVDSNLGSLLSRVGPQSGWLNTWWVRLSHLAPWLAGLVAAGAALDIYRRHRRSKSSRSAGAEI